MLIRRKKKSSRHIFHIFGEGQFGGRAPQWGWGHLPGSYLELIRLSLPPQWNLDRWWGARWRALFGFNQPRPGGGRRRIRFSKNINPPPRAHFGTRTRLRLRQNEHVTDYISLIFGNRPRFDGENTCNQRRWCTRLPPKIPITTTSSPPLNRAVTQPAAFARIFRNRFSPSRRFRFDFRVAIVTDGKGIDAGKRSRKMEMARQGCVREQFPPGQYWAKRTQPAMSRNH